MNVHFVVRGLLFGRPISFRASKSWFLGNSLGVGSYAPMLLRNEKAHSVTPATSYYWHTSTSSINCLNEPFWQEHVVGNLAVDTVHS